MTTLRARNYAGLSADERRLARRERLIEGAIRAYGELGYRNTTVKAVCEAAGLTERYFYESFANS
jgi:AcrR family transcriptional regulator